jgi:hypothetical protein
MLARELHSAWETRPPTERELLPSGVAQRKLCFDRTGKQPLARRPCLRAKIPSATRKKAAIRLKLGPSNQIAFADDSNQLSTVADNRESANPVLEQNIGSFSH